MIAHHSINLTPIRKPYTFNKKKDSVWKKFQGHIVSGLDEFVSCKVHQWVSDVSHFSRLAVPKPQVAFVATDNVSSRWMGLSSMCYSWLQLNVL